MTGSSTIGPGAIIASKYRLEEELGRGGFGAIFRALHLPDKRPVALKLLYSTSHQMGEAELEKRFERETLMAQELRHPYTVEQFDFGRSERGIRYIAMELLHGETLIERLERSGPLPTDLVIKVARGVLQALQLGHSKDIVHRDLKPENIMLCRIGQDQNFPKVLDFGAAKTVEGEHDITSAGLTLGSPAFMAPELLMGSPATPLCDLYALGLTLAEALIGDRIVQGRAAFDRAKVQLSPESLQVPPALEHHPLYPWLKRSFAKKPDQRFQTAEEMLRALDDIADVIHGEEYTGPMKIPSGPRSIAPENTDLIKTGPPQLPERPSSIPPSRPVPTLPSQRQARPANHSAPQGLSASRPAPPVAGDDDFAEERTEFMKAPSEDDFAAEATAFIPKPDLSSRSNRQPPRAADDDFAAERTEFISPPDEDDFASGATAFIPKPDLPQQRSSAFHSGPVVRTPPDSVPQRRTEDRSEPTPSPSGHLSGPQSRPVSTPDPATLQREPLDTPVEGHRRMPKSAGFGKSRYREDGEESVYTADKYEPSAATDFRTIKTSDGMKERRSKIIFIGVIVIFIIAFITIFWVGPDELAPSPGENSRAAVVPGR